MKIFKKQPLTNFDIEDILSHLPKFKGCHMRDKIPILKNHQSVVINLDDSNGGGTHWCALYNAKRMLLWFDSYGLPCPQEIINQYPFKKVQHNTSQYQPIDSVLCGYYCCYFINEMYEGSTYYNIIFELDMKNDKKNDTFISNYVKNKLLK